MRIPIRLVGTIGLAAAVVIGLGSSAWSQGGSFPTRPITIIVPYGPGGGSDQVARAMAPPLSKILKVPVQVVNKPGASGLAAMPDFMMAPADGYTLLQYADEAVSNYVVGRLKEHPGEDWIPLAIAQITFNQIYARPDDPRFPTWEAFVKYAREHPGKVKVAQVGQVTTMEQVAMLQLEKAQGFKVTQVSFDKPSERYAAFLGGHTDVMFEQPGDVTSLLDSRKLVPLLTLLRERPKAFADVPAFKDVGISVAPLFRWRGFFARKGLPEDRAKLLERAFAEAWKSPEFQEFNRAQYMHVIDSYRDTAGSRALIAESVAAFREIFKELGLVK